MAERICFHLDEHMPHSVARALRAAGIDVTTTDQIGFAGRPDAAHVEWARSQARVIVTDDIDFLVLARHVTDHRGILLCRRRNHSIGEIIEFVKLVHEAMEPAEMVGQILYL